MGEAHNPRGYAGALAKEAAAASLRGDILGLRPSMRRQNRFCKRPNKEKERGPTRKRVSHSYYCVAVVIPTRTGHLFGWRHSYYCVAVVIPTSIYGVAIYIGRTDIWTKSIYIFC